MAAGWRASGDVGGSVGGLKGAAGDCLACVVGDWVARAPGPGPWWCLRCCWRQLYRVGLPAAEVVCRLLAELSGPEMSVTPVSPSPTQPSVLQPSCPPCLARLLADGRNVPVQPSQATDSCS